MNKTQKLFSVLFLNLTLSVPTYAKVIEQKELNFEVPSEKLMKGEEYFSFKMVDVATFNKKYPEFRGLDSLSLRHRPDVKMIISKSAYVINKPIGFFDHQHVVDETFTKHVLGKDTVKKLDENTFKVTSSQLGHNFELTRAFDSDDVSTLSTSAAIQAVLTSKRLDVIVQSAPSTIFEESTQFSKHFEGIVRVAAYTSLKENKTLVVVYKVAAVKKKFAISKIMKPLFIQDVVNQKTKTESFEFSK